MAIELRPYQIACKEAIKSKYDKGIREQLIVEATGLGKRLQAVDLMKHFKRSLFLAHREELILQAYNEINDIWPMQAGIIKGSVFELDKKIVIGSVQTMYNRLDRIDPNTFDLIIVDEGHHFVSPTFLKTIRHFTPKLRTVWTATPRRLDGISMTNIAQEIVFEYRIENGIKDGWLCEIEAYQIKTQADLSGVKRTAGDFNQKELSERVDSRSRNNLIAMKYKQYATGRQAVAYCVDIQHSYNLRDILREHGIIAETIVSDPIRCPNRKELVERFKKGEIEVLVNCEILTEGFDYSDVGCVLMARPTQSETLYVQCIGRGTRLKSQSFREKHNVNNCIVLDFVDNTGKLSIMNAYELEKHMSIEDRMFMPKEQKEKLLLAIKERRERTIKQQAGVDKKINLMILPEVKVWDSEKMNDPATEKQIKWMKDIGVWQEDVEYTKAMASELISSRPASEWQIRWLAERRYDVSEGCSLGQYQRVKYSYDMKNKFAIDNADKAKILKQLIGNKNEQQSE
jgi:superfamily II DNA or RNA helicase